MATWQLAKLAAPNHLTAVLLAPVPFRTGPFVARVNPHREREYHDPHVEPPQKLLASRNNRAG